MLRQMLKVCGVLPMVVLAGCENPTGGNAPVESLRESPQAVMYFPPPPVSGNIYDSTTYLGPVALGGSVRTYFTQNPQYYSFKVTVPASLLRTRFEVTHEGTSMYLDTGLMVYGPKNASGSYGTHPWVQDDDYGYGQLSRIEAQLPAGEYLVVVSSATGAGKQFQLQTTCVSGAACPPPPAATPDTSGYGPGLTPLPLTAQLEATVEAGNEARYYTEGSLRAYDAYWPHPGVPTLSQADRSVMTLQEYSAFAADDAIAYSYAQAKAYLYSEFEALGPQLLATYGNGTENVQVAIRYHEYPVAPGASGWFRLFVILFPESKKVVVFEQTGYET
ncbi:hypothetical protein HPC49_47510 [Pyxidicoccus fallax]|uniref:Lipoprotein n=1 Tax=Pyxidicoccus fallax TaxID=394095 RepID=A0A848LG78_9BACT|nr:hypothetical protein [Pyxidicoccus fallax]NMO16353.1 hypothetical protein [Pyxidicoccus fallax]NPC85826.1 hypothetical protein [Pyxidicoccus fallax]